MFEYWDKYVPPFYYHNMNISQLKEMAYAFEVEIFGKKNIKKTYIDAIKKSQKVKDMELMFGCYLFLLGNHGAVRPIKFTKALRNKHIEPHVKANYILWGLSRCESRYDRKRLELSKISFVEHIKNYPTSLSLFEFVLFELTKALPVNAGLWREKIWNLSITHNCKQLLPYLMDNYKFPLTRYYETIVSYKSKKACQLVFQKLLAYKFYVGECLKKYLCVDVSNIIWLKLWLLE